MPHAFQNLLPSTSVVSPEMTSPFQLDTYIPSTTLDFNPATPLSIDSTQADASSSPKYISPTMSSGDKKVESWSSIYTTPPSIKYPYEPTEALGDIVGVSHALELFLASHMLESEEYCHKSDVKKWVFFCGSLPLSLSILIELYNL